jgi:AhpD family alkylhydroperoxidase
MTPILLAALLGAAADHPKPVPATRAEEKELLEQHKAARPRLPMPPPGDGPFARVNNGRFRQYYLPKEFQFGGLGGREKDPAETLDPTFKVMLFWVVSRANNCYYCLGHQEHKLLAAGLTDDRIAALDSEWAAFTPAERAALAFTKKLTFEPHLLTAADVEAMTKHYTPAQVLEVVVAVGGFNSMNRWTDGLNIPAEENGNFFKKDTKADLSTFKTPTAAKYANARSVVAALPAGATSSSAPSCPARPALEPRAEVEKQLQAAKSRTPVLPLAAEVPSEWAVPAPPPNWVKLLATFPKAGKARVDGVTTAAEKGNLPPRLRALIVWTAAREDRAWYALAIAKERLRATGLTDDQVFAADAGDGLSTAEAQVVAFARKLAVAPATVTDSDVDGLRKLYTDHQVAEIVHQVCIAALFDRLTEAAKLPLDQ